MIFSEKFVSASKEYTTIEKTVQAPYLRRSFNLEKLPREAVLTLAAPGFYELTVNGKNITKGLLAPYIANPDDIIYYDSYDIRKYLQKGENVLGFTLGDGILNCWGGFVWDFQLGRYRSAPKVAFALELTSGRKTEVLEADEQVLCHPSPVLWNDLRVGESYDARLEIPGWNLPGFDAAGWTPAIPAETPRGELRLCEADPILPRSEMQPTAIVPEGDAFRYEFPVNFSGVTRLKIKGTPGQKITLSHGEAVLKGKFYADNLIFKRPEYKDMPQYTQRVEYICKGGEEEIFVPSFCYMGFQYVLVEGITAEQATPDLLTYIVCHSALEERGSFSCSDDTMNAIQKMTRVSTLSNFWYIPTDCPHREKNGWTADASLSLEQALLNLNPEASYTEWLRNICKAQNDAGALPGIVPTCGWGFAWGNGPAWDHILVNLPYTVYLLRGDLKPAEIAAESILRYVSYLTTRTRPDGLIAIGLGDWCATHGAPKSPLEFTDSVMSYDICRKASLLFEAMGKQPQADFCMAVADGFRTAIREHLIDFSTMICEGNCQTSQAMAIYYGILTPAESQTALLRLVEMVHGMDDHLDVGVLGNRCLFDVLTRGGYADLAYRIFTRETGFSYRQWVELGYTSLPENFSRDKNRIASLNHHFWGDVSGWMIRSVAGIRLNPTEKNAKEVLFAPAFISDLTHAEAEHLSPEGKLACGWKRVGEDVILSIEYPETMKARIQLPVGWHSDQGIVSEPMPWEKRASGPNRIELCIRRG